MTKRPMVVFVDFSNNSVLVNYATFNDEDTYVGGGAVQFFKVLPPDNRLQPDRPVAVQMTEQQSAALTVLQEMIQDQLDTLP